MTADTKSKQSEDELIELLGKMEADIMNVVGDEFAPKQPDGSPERKRLLKLLGETYHIKTETATAILALIERWELEARVDELKKIKLAQQDYDRWSGFCMDDTSDFGNYIEQRLAQLSSDGKKMEKQNG